MATPGYFACHKRVTRARGPARLHRCVDCGRRASEWSYDRSDPDEITATGRGWSTGRTIRFSPNPAHYAPRCVSCHRRFDWGHWWRLGVGADDLVDAPTLF